ncbi:FadR/GntR family transcriptional regulator [Leifsonia sp. L25]|uniref:FadR/GntR family transcriptional regulator n=1 Tax=Actinomycetes TaxID=1760 RepID=UPI003D6958A7
MSDTNEREGHVDIPAPRRIGRPDTGNSSETEPAAEPGSARVLARRVPQARLGVVVVADLVEVIVTGQVQPGELLPPEGPLADQFGVSRTVIRESVKRLEEKGLVTVAQGRGTRVTPFSSWNVLDPVVLSALVDNDASLGVLDELSEVRASLESSMAGTAAATRSAEQLVRLQRSLETMRSSEQDSDSFRQADILFHFTVMELSGNRLAENIAKVLFKRALESNRYQGVDPEGAFGLTLAEHSAVVEAIASQDVGAAQASMREHIARAWERRRFPDHRPAHR